MYKTGIKVLSEVQFSKVNISASNYITEMLYEKEDLFRSE